MNEVTKIHLGRQAFAISAEAHRELRDYLDAIRKRVDDDSVISEVELRMAELLGEHGVHGEQVILPGDVDFLKKQLGEPSEFAESDEPGDSLGKSGESKRLFRDTDNAMLAGVAAGLGNYFGIDALIVRLLFVIATLTGGWGILLYLVLWLLVPEAKTSADRLQMAGKPVTIKGLKEVVERADVQGAARRANKSLATPVRVIDTILRGILEVIGVCLMIIGLALLLSLAGGVSYVFLRSDTLLQDSIFPIGFKEHLAVYIGAAVGSIIALFIVLLGMAMFRRKWPIRAWITGTLLGLLFIGLAVGGALTADIVPQVRNRYNANLHTTTRTMQPFTQVDLTQLGDNESVDYKTAPTYSVSMHYYGHPDLKPVKTSVNNGVLIINSRRFDWQRRCDAICIPNDYDLHITVSSPKSVGPRPLKITVPPLIPS